MLRRTLIATSFALLALPVLAAGQTPDPSAAGSSTVDTFITGSSTPETYARESRAVSPGIRLWTSHSETYRRGERVRIYFRTERDAYVTIFRVDTDGRVRVLFPHDPNDPNLAHGGETYNVQGIDDRDAFSVDDPPGVGYVFGVASQDEFSYDALTGNDHWNIQEVANLTDGRVHSDPAASLQDLVQRIEPAGYAAYDTHLLPYYVEQRYDYPRFLCYDCHAYMPYAYWNPYSQFCSRFSLFVNYDPFYYYPSYWYPTRYYGGTNVVYVRPRFGRNQFEFRTPGDRSAPSVVYRDRRNTGVPGMPSDRGVRGVDLGGVGSVPSPVGGGGRRMVGGGGALQSPGGAPVQRPLGGQSAPQASGRRYAPVTDLGVIGPSTPSGTSKPPLAAAAGRRYIGEAAQPAARGTGQIAPEAPRARGVYIEPGYRPTQQPAERSGPGTPPAAGRYSQPGSSQQPRAEGQPAPRSEPRGAAPRAQPRGESRPAGRSGGTPTLIRRRP